MPFIWDDEQQGGVAAPPVSLPQPPQQPTTNGFVWDDQQPQLQVPEPLVADPTFGGRYVASQPSPEQRALMVQAGRVDPLGLAMNPVGLSALSLPTLPADNEPATKVWKSSGKTWREMTDAERRQAVEMDTIDQAQTPEAKQRLIRDSVARDQELQPGYKIDQSKLPPKPAGTPVPIPQQVLDAMFEQIQNLPDGPEKDRLIQAHATGQQLSAQARADIAAAEARGMSTVQYEAAQSPWMQALSNLGGQNIGGDVARGVLLGLTGVGNTVTNVLLRTADKARRRLAAGEDGTQPVGQGIFGDVDSYVNRRNDALEFVRQAMSANQGERSIFPASMVQNASETLTTIGAMDALGIPIIPGFAAQIADTTYSDDRKKGLSEDKAAFHAAGTAALQSALMLMAGRAGKELGLIPREELMSPAMAKAAQDVFTKEGLGTATKNILFQGGEGAAIHIAQSAFDAATGARPDALDPENLWPEAGKAGFDWAALGVLGTAGHAGPEAVRSAWARALNKLPGAMSRAHAAEQRLIDQLASNRAISRSDLEAVGVSTRGYKPREFNALAEQYIQDQLMPREVQKQRQDYMEQQSKFIPAAMNRFTTLNPQMPGGPESFIAGPQGGAESFTVDRNTVLPEVPDAQGIGKQVEAGSEAQGAQGQASGGVRVRDDATSDGLEAGPQEVAQPKQPWEMTYDEVLKAVNPSNREELQAARPILAALYPEEIDNGADQWGIRRAIEKGDELPRTPTVELSRRHRDAIRAALDAGLPVPENVLAEYPDLASSRAQSVQPTATDATVAPTQPQEPSNGSQEQAGQVGEEVQQVNAEGQGRQSDAQGQELLGGAVPKNPLVTEQQPVDQSPAVSARQPKTPQEAYDAAKAEFSVASQNHEQARVAYRARQIGDEEYLAARQQLVEAGKKFDQAEKELLKKPSAKDFVASLAKPKKGERPRTLTADDFVRQVRMAATSPEEAESIIALASANAEYRNQSLDAWVGENIAGVEKTDAKKSAYLKQFPDGPPDALAHAAYHASPHRFDKFTTDHIGTGEGNQAFGWGLYFAGNKEVAGYYHDMFNRRMNARTTSEVRVNGVRENDAIHQFEGGDYQELQNLIYYARLFNDPEYALSYARDHAADPTFYDRNKIEIMPREKGAAMYKVDLRPTDDELLNWDKPLRQQSPKVQAALESAYISRGMPLDDNGRPAYFDRDPDGHDLYTSLGGWKGDEVASKLLLEHGVRGIKFMDQISRSAPKGQMKYRVRWNDAGDAPEVYDYKTGKAIDKKFANFSNADSWIAEQDDSEHRSYNYVIFDGADAVIDEVLAQKERKVRGEVQFLKNDGRAIIRAFKGSQNVATLAHELGHVFRRTLLPEDMRTAERALGVKEGKKWTRPQEERFARHFERYLRDGVAPTKKLATVFEKFKNWLTTIYRNLAGGPLKDEIPPELRDVFDRMLGATDAQIAERNGGDASFDFGANELDTNGKASLKEADKGIAKLQRREMIGDELLAIWNELSDQDKVLTWESAKQTASDENYYKSSLKNEFDTLFNSSPEDEFQQIVTKQGKKIIRKVSNAGRASAQARMVEYNAGDSAQIPGFDKKVAGLDELPLMKGEAYARGNGSLEVGLFDILRGGGKQFDTTPPEDYLLNYLDEEYGRRQAQENPVGEDRGTADQGGSPAESGNGSVEVQPGAGEAAAAPAAAPFELSREGSPDASPIVEAYQPERIAEAGPSERQPLLDGTPADMASGTLEGQQGLFQAAGGTPTVEFPSSVKNASTAADREAMGLPPRPEVEPHTWPSADQEALATLYRDPQAGQKIVAELLQQEKPRPLNDNETFILSNHIVRLKNEINAIARQSADAEDAGDAQAVADLKERYDDLSQQLFDADRAAESTGTEQSRGLNARKALKNADYSLASMELRERVALGRPLTEDERKKLMERDRKRRRKLAEIEDTEADAKQKAFIDASDRQRKRARVEKKEKKEWTPDEIDLTPDSEQLDINRTVEQLARYYFRQGITDREENIMAVHEYLQPYLYEGWTLDDARDALSGYGEIRPLSDKAEDQWYRQTRREQQKVRKLIDMLAGRPPKITGTEREEPNQENRDLTKTVNNYKRFYNITSGDDASNARSALDAVKTRLNNEIRDLEKQIREKTKIIKRKNDIQYDTEANDLKAKRDALKAQFDEIFGKPEMTDAKRMELAMKAMERNMAELDRRIKERDFTVSTPRVFDSPEYRALKTKQDAMRAEYENLREYDPQYMEQQRQKRLAAVEARIADYEQQIATGNFATPAARKAVDLDLQAAQEVRDALRKRRNEVRKTDPEWMRQQQLKEARRLEVRLLKRAERLADRMGRQDYTSKPAERQHGPLDEKLSRLYDELNKMQREFDDHVYDVNLRGTLQARIADKKRQMDTKVFVDRPQREARPISPETKLLAAQAKVIDKAYERERQQYERTVIGHLWDATNLMRLFQTTGEYSPVLLQGGKEAAASLGGLAVGDVTTGKDFGTAVLRGFKAFASPEYAKAHDKALFENPRLPLWMDAGLRLILEGEHITPSEELEYSKKLLNHIPIARKIIPRFEDMARVFYNDMRTSAFDAMTIMKPDATPEQLHALARFANVSTGYSTLGSQGEAAAKAASVFLFSPRNLAANFRYAIFEPVMRGDAKGVRTIILKKYAKTLIGVAVAFGLAKLGGADISLDPSSPDFLKWKFGNTRLNPLAGLQQLFVMGYRSATGKTTSSDGNARNTDAYSVHAQFLRGKLAPQLALGYDLLAGKNVVGEPVNFDLTGDHFPYVLPNLLDRITPMTYSDVVKAIQEQGVPRGSAIGIAALFGMPTQTYQPKQHPGSPRNRAPRERRPKR